MSFGRICRNGASILLLLATTLVPASSRVSGNEPAPVLNPNKLPAALKPGDFCGGTAVSRPRIDPDWLTDSPSLHGMVLMGHNPYYISHLPMFMSPHDYQAIFEVRLTGAGVSALASQPAGQLLTIAPSSFVLPQMAQDSGQFTARIYSGHFERGGTEIASGVSFQIVRTVYFQKLRTNATRPTTARRILFGDSSQQFLAHEIVSPPDFDQIHPISVTDTRILNAMGQRSHLLVESEQANQALPEGSGSAISGRISSNPDLGNIPVGQASAPIYTEFGDLENGM